jgi:hypothetical protein
MAITDFFKSFWVFLFKKILKYQILSLWSYGELQSQNDTNYSSLAFIYAILGHSWLFLRVFENLYSRNFKNSKFLVWKYNIMENLNMHKMIPIVAS